MTYTKSSGRAGPVIHLIDYICCCCCCCCCCYILGDLSKGDVITPYAPPTPPRGTHRYIFLLYKQPAGVALPVTPVTQRAKFHAASWAAKHDLGEQPVAATYFTASAGAA
jgi:phosphatidylethanolamine-binding protein (PEBP) family uncharacterized protein